VSGQLTPLVEVRGLVKEFALKGHRGAGLVKAVTAVDLEVHAGEAVGLVGESGSGKTTLARCILRLVEPTAGSIRVDGVDISHLRGEGLRQMRPRMQVVFQDPVGSLDPRMSVFDLIAEPLRAHRSLSRSELRDAVERLIDDVGLARNLRHRRPHELSGGQCQRVAIARAISLQPRLLILDEPTSALDVSVQAQVLELLVRLRAEHDLTYLLISHDLGVVRYLCERVAVMYLGRIVEQGPTRQIFEAAQHPYTRALILARPDVDADGPPRLLLSGEIPSATSPPAGCAFHPRCWLRERLGQPEACHARVPTMTEGADGQIAACHFVDQTAERFEQEVNR
jgi:oligopeptide/dipeptide ABC transporter ATP-binding protein